MINYLFQSFIFLKIMMKEDLEEESQFGTEYNSKDSHVSKKKEKSISSCLMKFSLPENIIQNADRIYNEMRPQVRRAKTYNMLLYYCTYCAYLEYIHEQTSLSKGALFDSEGYIDGFDAIELGKKFNLTKGQIQKCDSLFSPLQTGYKPPSSCISLFVHIPNYCKCINLSKESIMDVIELTNELLKKEPKLGKENPRSTAAGIVYYFTVINGIEINNMEQFTKLVNYSFNTIENIYKEISIIDNK
jgi:transcription initiation factor TFIIIB Brf1 subunit/transcription initiation factor TFIIB